MGGQLLIPLLTSCEIWGKLFDHSKAVPINEDQKNDSCIVGTFCVKLIMEYL